MTIAIVLQNNYPSDREVRTRKIVESLDRDGIDVVVFSRNTTYDPAKGREGSGPLPSDEVLPHARVRRFSWFAGSRLFPLVTFPAPFNPFWALWLFVGFWREGVTLIVVNNVRAGFPCGIASRLLGLPMIFDLPENFPELAKSVTVTGIVDRIAFDPRVAWALERSTIWFADRVWVVVQERRQELIDDGVPAAKLQIVGNTPVLDGRAGDPAGSAGDEPFFPWSGFTLVYVGVLNEFRGLDLVIEGLAHAHRTSDEDLFLAVAGDGPHKDALVEAARRLEVDDSVRFLGWISPEAIPRFLASGDVGVIPHRVNGFTNTTVPNKLFDYMRAGLPVLATDMNPVRRIVTEERCGRILPEDATSDAVARLILEMKNDDLQAMGENGRRAVLATYNWERDAETVLEAVRELRA